MVVLLKNHKGVKVWPVRLRTQFLMSRSLDIKNRVFTILLCRKWFLEILEEMKDFSNQDFSTHFTQYSSHSKENWPFVPYKDTLESP